MTVERENIDVTVARSWHIVTTFAVRQRISDIESLSNALNIERRVTGDQTSPQLVRDRRRMKIAVERVDRTGAKVRSVQPRSVRCVGNGEALIHRSGSRIVDHRLCAGRV